jgi:hypothetical protein
MKRTLSALIALCVVPTIAIAQGGIGIKGGLSYGNVTNSGALPGSVVQRSGFAVGVSLNTGGVIGIGLEGLYAQRGVTSDLATDSRRLDYIDVPLYVRLSIPLGIVSPFAYVGPQGSYELKCETEVGDCPDTDRPRFTYAGVIGAGLRFAGFSVEGRYIYGLQDLKLSTVSSSESYKTRSFMVLFGVGF